MVVLCELRVTLDAPNSLIVTEPVGSGTRDREHAERGTGFPDAAQGFLGDGGVVRAQVLDHEKVEGSEFLGIGDEGIVVKSNRFHTSCSGVATELLKDAAMKS